MEITVTIPDVKACISFDEERRIAEQFIHKACGLAIGEDIDETGDVISSHRRGGIYLRKAKEKELLYFNLLKVIDEYCIRKSKENK